MEWFNDYEQVGQLAIGLFFSIVFLQSAVDKILDWSGNKSWLTSHFTKSFLAPVVTPMLGILTVVELAAGLVSACGVVCFLICNSAYCIYLGLCLSILALLMLLTGQRLAKDYDGAKTIAIYFGIAILGLLFF